MSRGPTEGRTWRVGAVSYLNSKPLVEGLDAVGHVTVTYDVPARLPDLLNRGQVDVALVPVIDLARFGPAWEMVSDACIGCDGRTLTVRVFSRVPPERITHLTVDGDSHTSVALARVIWGEKFNRDVQISRFEPWELDECQALLLIGDKVVAHGVAGFDYQVDLGEAWAALTGLPFVFAVWARRRDADVRGLGELLGAARDRGVASASAIAAREADGRGWPPELALRYLTRHLQFTLTPRHRRGMERFFESAHRWGLLTRPPSPALAPSP